MSAKVDEALAELLRTITEALSLGMAIAFLWIVYVGVKLVWKL